MRRSEQVAQNGSRPSSERRAVKSADYSVRLLGPGDLELLLAAHSEVFDHPVQRSWASEFLADARPGPRLVRMFNGSGASAPRFFLVGSEPQLPEREPNDERKNAQVVEGLPATIAHVLQSYCCPRTPLAATSQSNFE